MKQYDARRCLLPIGGAYIYFIKTKHNARFGCACRRNTRHTVLQIEVYVYSILLLKYKNYVYYFLGVLNAEFKSCAHTKFGRTFAKYDYSSYATCIYPLLSLLLLIIFCSVLKNAVVQTILQSEYNHSPLPRTR